MKSYDNDLNLPLHCSILWVACTFFVAAFNDRIEFQCKCSHFDHHHHRHHRHHRHQRCISKPVSIFRMLKKKKQKKPGAHSWHYTSVWWLWKHVHAKHCAKNRHWSRVKKDTLTGLMCARNGCNGRFCKTRMKWDERERKKTFNESDLYKQNENSCSRALKSGLTTTRKN